MTPEGRMKRAIGAVLANYKGYVYVHMPVPTGYGTSTLDYLGVCCGQGFAIEAKRLNGRPTLRQIGVIEQMQRAGVKVFVVNSPETLAELDRWLADITTTVVGEQAADVKTLRMQLYYWREQANAHFKRNQENVRDS